MWSPSKILRRVAGAGRALRASSESRLGATRRPLRAEKLEPRRLMVADPIHVGIVYLETDYLESDDGWGADEIADRFIVSFSGGAPQTELTQFRVSLDKDSDGLSIGDLIFDTAAGGRGKAGWHPFKVKHIDSLSGEAIEVLAEVDDGSTELLVTLTNFKAGDRLEFSIDVDEVLRMHGDPERFNAALDVIASGQEMQDAIFSARFEAPHYQVAAADALFVNDFSDPSDFGLRLPPDQGESADSRPSRSAAAIAHTQQSPKPISIAGTVWVDDNLNLKREAGEEVLSGVLVTLLRKDETTGRFVATGHSQRTDAAGAYRFGTELGLMPGEYQVAQSQPQGFYSVGAVAGFIDAQQVGRAASSDLLTGIKLPLGDLHAVNYDFAEARPAAVSGWVYHDQNQNGLRDPAEPPIAGTTIELIDHRGHVVATTQTDARGYYEFTDLVAGEYSIRQLQPTGYLDGLDSAGTIDGAPVGTAVNPGDLIVGVMLRQGRRGIDYNFGELQPASLAGRVHVDLDDDCLYDPGEPLLAGVQMRLLDAAGREVARTVTDSEGRYRFEGLVPGSYSVVQLQPAGYFSGTARPGSAGGIKESSNRIGSIALGSGEVAVDYDFCEKPPAEISGFVYVDQNQNQRRDSGEAAIGGVQVDLLDQHGKVVATATTDASGFYRFTYLPAGQYTVRQTQPAGFLQGSQQAGSAGGDDSVDDLISHIPMAFGAVLTQYNFGELQPASLAGRVHVDLDDDCLYDPGEPLLAGVQMRLLDAAGREVARTVTDAEGRYRFEGLVPGTYSVVQLQPEGYFSGTARPGSAGGVKESSNRIGSITLGSGEVAVDYDFCEKPPAEISGFVYVDQNQNQRRDTGEAAIGGVQVDLLDQHGKVVATATTDASGFYRFTYLPAGQYTVRQTQPAGFLQGSQQAGSAGGDDSVDDLISHIPMAFGAVLTQYNFGELQPASLAGRVHVDLDDDCLYDPGEPLLAGVQMRLLDAAGREVARTLTDAEGRYRFDGLVPGTYSVVQLQPEGYFSGTARPGSAGGVKESSNRIGSITLGSGEVAVDYDFCEKPPAEISGFVYVDQNQNQRRDTGERPIAHAHIELVDAAGNVVARTHTDANGFYRFADLPPGTYSLRQTQPYGYFHGGQVAGNLGGDDSLEDVIAAIALPGGAVAVDYDFPELAPGAISGYVFQDGTPLELAQPPDPVELRRYRDGLRTQDDLPIAGVILQLRDAQGNLVSAQHALPGAYEGVIQVVTDSQGFYQFVGLRPGVYHVYQIQPQDYIDSLDTAGTGGGVAVNAGDLADDPQLQTWLSELAARGAADPGHDAILGITLGSDAHAQENNFSEILIEPPVSPPPPVPPPPVPPPPIHEPASEPVPYWVPPVEKLGWFELADNHHVQRPIVADAEYLVTWHLSIINGGYPRGPATEAAMRKVAARTFDDGFAAGNQNAGRWLLVGRDGQRVAVDEAMTLGRPGGRALVGDFNGDGLDEIAIFAGGQWFVDLNGNGVWDDGDLWLQLGTEMDRPVVGDWDGDGKADIAIFGRQWQQDPEVIVRDPGLPSPANTRRRVVGQAATAQEPELEQERILRHGRQGPIRSDAIDHVFRYGEQADTPLAGDWNGTGIDSIGVFRGGHWLLDSDADGRFTARDDQAIFGEPGDIPIVGDWNGDGVTDLGVVRGDLWIIDSDGDRRLTANDLHVRIPRPSEDAQPVVGDWDGDGADEFGWYHDAG